MGRRRYVSTDISTDPAVGELARRFGVSAALLYTWLIPAAADDTSVPANPRELMLKVAPDLALSGLLTEAAVTAAVNGMLELGLLIRYEHDDSLRFPPETFYECQSYIKAERRWSPPADASTRKQLLADARDGAQVQPTDDERARDGRPADPTVDIVNSGTLAAAKTPQNTAEHRNTAQNAADTGESAQTTASFKSSFKSPVTPPIAPPRGPRRRSSKRDVDRVLLTDEDIGDLVVKWRDKFGSDQAVRDVIGDALNSTARLSKLSERQYVDGWLRREPEPRPLRLLNGRPEPPPRRIVDHTGKGSA